MNWMLKAGAVAATLATSTGCFGRGNTIVGVGPDRPPDTAWDDTWDPGETGETGVDTDITSGPRGGLVFPYTFEPGMLGATSCAEAHLDTISVVLHPSGDVRREPLVFPCMEQDLRIYDLAVGLYSAQIVGGEAPGVTWESAPVDVYVPWDDVREVPVVLVCQSNDVDDGCGGA